MFARLTQARRRIRNRIATLLRDMITLGAVLPPARAEAEVISLEAHRKLKKARAA